jgi:hypothetical protein
MHHPKPVTCDFCDQPIDTSTPWTTIEAVVPKDIAEEAREHHEQRVKQAMPHGFFGIQMPVSTPTHYTVDVCRMCEDKRVPDLRPLVALRIKQLLDKARERASEPGAKPQFKADD